MPQDFKQNYRNRGPSNEHFVIQSNDMYEGAEENTSRYSNHPYTSEKDYPKHESRFKRNNRHYQNISWNKTEHSGGHDTRRNLRGPPFTNNIPLTIPSSRGNRGGRSGRNYDPQAWRNDVRDREIHGDGASLLSNTQIRGGMSNNDVEKQYDELLKSFMDDNDMAEFTFPSTLSALERMTIHKLAVHYDLNHKSSGSKDERILKISKNVKAVKTYHTIAGYKVLCKTTEGFQGLQMLDDKHLDAVSDSVISTISPFYKKMIKMLEKIIFSPKPIIARNKKGFSDQKMFYGAPPVTPSDVKNNLASLTKFRQKLPAYEKRNVIIHSVRDNRVVIISGSTGCGKTTQVPQLLYDANILDKGMIIICTQPRRISAISVAQRVAAERGEACGNSTGYVIRFEQVASASTRIMYMTTGILLRKMHTNPTLKGVSCVIVDEVHERSVETDFTLLMLRDLVTTNINAPKVILMSATLQIERLVKYFSLGSYEINSPPSQVSISGNLFPVKELFAEDALRLLSMPNDSPEARKMQQLELSMQETVPQDESASATDEVVEGNVTAEYINLRKRAIVQINKEQEIQISYNLVNKLVEHFHVTDKNFGASILVFLPGWKEISSLANILNLSEHVHEFCIFILHSSVSSKEQAQVFMRAPVGFRKIILATVIAETSITIDDVVYVIDCGVLKATGYDNSGSMVSLQTQLISKANGIQRRGRAGRVQAGVCVHLLPRKVYDGLPEFLPPEILRSPLEEVCLQLKAIDDSKTCMETLSRAIDPPSLLSIEQASSLLKHLGALDSREKLTALGRVLATMPINPRLGKMLLISAELGVLGPVSIIASTLMSKNIFIRPMNHQLGQVDAVRLDLDKGDFSDHLVLLRLYQGWMQNRCSHYADRHFADPTVLKGVQNLVNQLQKLVVQSGFLRNILVVSGKCPTRGEGSRYKRFSMQEEKMMLYHASRHENNEGLIIFAISWSLYPRMASVERGKKKNCVRDMYCWDQRYCVPIRNSVLAKANLRAYENREFVVYFDRMRIETRLNLMDGSLISRLVFLLCVKRLTVDPIKGVPPEAITDNESVYKGYVEYIPENVQPEEDYSIIHVDNDKKMYCCLNKTAIAVRSLREVISFYFNSSIENVDVTIFPEEIVQAIGEAIFYPVQKYEISSLASMKDFEVLSLPTRLDDNDDQLKMEEDITFENNIDIDFDNLNLLENGEVNWAVEGGGDSLVDKHNEELAENIVSMIKTQEVKKIWDTYGELAFVDRVNEAYVGGENASLSPNELQKGEEEGADDVTETLSHSKSPSNHVPETSSTKGGLMGSTCKINENTVKYDPHFWDQKKNGMEHVANMEN